MIRLLFYTLILTIVFLVGLIIGIERDVVKSPERSQIEGFEEVFFESLSPQTEAEKPVQLIESDRLLTKLAFFCEKLVLGFYQIIVKVLYQIAKLFI